MHLSQAVDRCDGMHLSQAVDKAACFFSPNLFDAAAYICSKLSMWQHALVPSCQCGSILLSRQLSCMRRLTPLPRWKITPSEGVGQDAASSTAWSDSSGISSTSTSRQNKNDPRAVLLHCQKSFMEYSIIINFKVPSSHSVKIEKFI